MTITEINNLTLDLTFLTILSRMVDFTKITNKQDVYTLSKDQTKSMYVRATLNKQLVKPTLKAMNTELALYKKELTDQENARLKEVARVKAIQDRFKLIENDIHSVKYNTFFKDYPNPAIILQEITQNNNTLALTAMEKNHTALKATRAKEARVKKLDELRKIRDTKLKEVDYLINDLALGVRTDKAAILAYQTKLKTITDQFKKVNGDPKVSVDNLNLQTFTWPTKLV